MDGLGDAVHEGDHRVIPIQRKSQPLTNKYAQQYGYCDADHDQALRRPRRINVDKLMANEILKDI